MYLGCDPPSMARLYLREDYGGRLYQKESLTRNPRISLAVPAERINFPSSSVASSASDFIQGQNNAFRRLLVTTLDEFASHLVQLLRREANIHADLQVRLQLRR